MNDPDAPVTIYTIGHSNLPLDRFIEALQQFGIQSLVDIRTKPMSRFSPHFNRARLEQSLADAGIAYHFEGEALGGRPTDPSLYKAGVLPTTKDDQLNLVDYAEYAHRDWFRAGVSRLRDVARTTPTAMMCSEEDPQRCHCHHLVERALPVSDRVLHIRTKGGVRDETLAVERFPTVSL